MGYIETNPHNYENTVLLFYLIRFMGAHVVLITTHKCFICFESSPTPLLSFSIINVFPWKFGRAVQSFQKCASGPLSGVFAVQSSKPWLSSNFLLPIKEAQ